MSDADLTLVGAGMEDLARVLDADGRVNAAALERHLSTLDASDAAALLSAALPRARSLDDGRSLAMLAVHQHMDEGQAAKADDHLRRLLSAAPRDLEALTLLVKLSREAGRPVRAALLLERALEAAETTERQAELAMSLAELCRDELGEREHALAAYFRAFELRPDAPPLSDARRLLLAEGRWEEAAEVLFEETTLLLGWPPPGEASELPSLDGKDPQTVARLAEAHRVLGIVLLDHAVHHGLSRELLEQARALGDGAALAALDDLEARVQGWSERAVDAQSRGRTARDKREAAAAYLEAAQLFLVYGQDHLRAEECFDRARLLHPGHRATLRAMEAVETSAGRHDELLKRLTVTAASVKDAEVKARLLASAVRTAEMLMAEVAADDDDPRRGLAEDALLQALQSLHELRPEDRELVVRLGSLLAERGAHEARAQVLERFARSVPDADLAVETRLELGRVAVEELGDTTRGRTHFEAALASRPDDVEAASALRALYRDAGEQALLLEVLKVLVDQALHGSRALALAEERLEVARALSNEEALAAARAVFELRPDVDRVDEMEDLAERTGRWESLAEAFVLAATLAADDGVRADWWRRAANTFDRRLPKPREAARAWREVLKASPQDAEAKDAVERLLRDEDDPTALAEALRARVEDAADEDERQRARLRLGEVLERRLDRTEEAVEVLEAALAAEPEDEAALSAAARLYERTQRWSDLEPVLARLERIRVADSAARADVLVRRAGVLNQLGREAAAVPLWLDLLSTAPEQALPPLEAALAAGHREAEIAAALEPLYEARGLKARRRDMLALIGGKAEDGESRRRAALESARLSIELGEGERALEGLLQALEETPDDAELLSRVLSSAASLDARAMAAEGLERAARPAPASVQAKLLHAIGELWSGVDDQRSLAGHLLALDAEPGHPGALAASVALHGAMGRHEALAERLEVQLQRAEGEARVRIALTLGALREEQLGNPEGALAAYRGALEADPDEPIALARLANRITASEAPQELVGLLDRLRAQATDQQAAAELDVRAGEVLRVHLDDREGAFQRYLRAVETGGRRSDVRVGLEALLEDPALRARAGAALEPLIDPEEDPGGLARAVAAQLEHDEQASAREARALRVAELETRAGRPGPAFGALLVAFEAGDLSVGNYEQLATRAAAAEQSEILLRSASVRAEAASEAELWRFYARLAGEGAQIDSARRGWTAVLALEPGDGEALDALEKLTAAGDDPAALAEVLETRGSGAPTPSERARYYRRAAAIWEEAAEDPERALRALETARRQDPTERGAWLESARILAGLGRGAERAEALREAAMRTEAASARAAVLVEEADVRLELDDEEGSVGALERALEVMPESPEARSRLESALDQGAPGRAALALEPIYRRGGEWSRLADVYRLLAESSEDPRERAERWVAIRSIEEERLGRMDKAWEAAERAFREQPMQPALRESLERVALRSGRAERLPTTLLEMARTLAPGSAQIELLEAATRAADAHGLDPQLSMEAWAGLAEARPAADTLRTYAARARAAGDALAAASALESLARTAEGEERAEMLVAVGESLEGTDADRATQSFKSALALAPGDERALDGLRRSSPPPEVLADALEAALEALPPEARVRAWLELGQLRRAELSAPDGAVTALAKVLELGGDDDLEAAAGQGLEALMEANRSERPALAARAAEAGEAYWHRRQAFSTVILAKEVQSEAADPDDRGRLRKSIAHIYEAELRQPEMAFLTLGRAFLEAPEDDELVEGLEALSTSADVREEWAELNAEIAGRDGPGQLAAARRAATLTASLGPASAAVPHLATVLRLDPNDHRARDALERLHREEGDAAGLVRLHREALETALEPSEQLRRWTEVADLSEHELSDVEGAAEALAALRRLQPEDVDVLRRLSALGARADRPGLAVEALQAEVARTDDPDARASLHLQIGALKRDRLGALDEAVEAYGAALVARPNDPGAVSGLAALLREAPSPDVAARAATLLAPTYLETGAIEEYVACLERMAAVPGPHRVDHLETLAEVYETRLGRAEQAFAAARRAFHEDPARPETRARLERLAEENGLAEDLAAVYLDEAEGPDAGRHRVDVLRRAAEIYAQLGDTERAIAEYERVLEGSPGDEEVLVALESLYRDSQQHERLVEIYRRRIARAEDVPTRVHLMRAFAGLQAEQLDDAPGAIATLRRLTQLAEDDVDALDALARLLEREGRSTELADVLERLVGHLPEDDTRAVEARVRLGRVRAEGLGDLAGSERWLAEALRQDPKNRSAQDFLQERFEDAVADDDRVLARRTGELLATALRASEDWAQLVSVLQLQAGLEPAAAERVPVELEVARLQSEKLGTPELALGTLTGAVRAAPGLTEAREQFESVARTTHREDLVLEVYEGVRGGVADTEVREALERRIADLAEPLDPERAFVGWQTVLEASPQDADALQALDRLGTRLGRWAALADVLERRLACAAGEDARYELAMRLGMVWDERLSEPEEAVRAYRQAREARPRSREPLEALARLLATEDSARELAGILEVLAEQAPDKRTRRRLEGRLADLSAGPLDDPERALRLWSSLASEDPSDEEARRALESLYERTQRWPELAHLLEQSLEGARDEQELLRIQRKLGFIRGARLGSVDEAVASWQEILRRNPNDVEALNALRETYRGAERWDELVAVLRKLVPLQPEVADVKLVRFELAEVLFEKLGRLEDGVESAKRVLDLDPHTPAELMRLEELFTTAEAHGEAVRVKMARADAAETRGEQTEILFEVAELYTSRIQRRAGAVGAYERILALQPDSTKAYDALARLLEEGGEYRKLVELHDRRLEVVEEAEARRHLLLSIVDIQERRLGHPELAFGAACRAFAEEGADAEAQNLAERLAAATDNWDLLADVYEAQAENAGVERALELRRRLGEICLDHLKEEARGEAQLRAVLERRPDDRARRRLNQLYTETERWSELVALIGDEVDHSGDVEVKRRLLFEIAELEERSLGDPDAAIGSIKRALDLDPQDERALDHLGRIYRDHSRWRPLVELLERRASAAEGERAVELRFELADVVEKGVSDSTAAVEAHRDVLSLSPGHRPSLDALERLHSEAENWGPLIDVYEARVRVASGPNEVVGLLTQVAGIQEERFGDAESAATTYSRALSVDPDNVTCLVQLARIWRSLGRHEALLETLERHVPLSRDEDEAVDILLEQSELLRRELDDPESALQVVLRADALRPERRDVLQASSALHEAAGRWREALVALSREAELVGEGSEAAELSFRQGQLWGRLERTDEAREAYAAAVELDPRHGPSLRALRGLREAEGSFEDAIELEAQEAEHTADLEEKAKLFHHAAEQALERFDDVSKATRFLESGLAADPGHVPSLEVLSDLHFSEERWDEAERLLQRLIRELNPTADRGTLGRLHYRLAYIAEKRGDTSAALERYHASYAQDSTYLPTLEGLGGALLEAERWEDAQRIFQAILIQHKSALTDAEVVDLHFQVGALGLKLEDGERARKSFERALELDRSHVPTLGAFADLSQGEGRFEDAYDLRERMLELLLDDDERFEALLMQAKLSEQNIQEPWRAIDAYAEAKRLRPDDVEVMRSLVHLYRETSQVPRALEVLGELGLLLTERGERREVFLQMARIHHEQQGNVPAAVQALNAALDVDPTHVEAFSRIEQILYETRAWSALEENYHRMLKRLPKSQRKGRVVIWRSLADLYAKVLNNEEGARIAYEVLHRLEPEDHEVTAELAERYTAVPEMRLQAAELQISLVPVVDDPAVPVRGLFNLFFEMGALDRSFCALGALVLMGVADATEKRAYAGLLRYVPSGLSRALTDALWREVLLHPYCRGPLATLASVVYRGAPGLFESRRRQAGLRSRKERVDLSDTRKNAPARLRYFDVWGRLQRVMHVPEAELYLRPQGREAPTLLPGAQPALVAGRQHEIFATASTRRLAWTLGRQMALSRPELALAAALDPEDLAVCMEAALRLHVPEGSGVDLGLSPADVASWERALRRQLGERALGALREPALAVVEDRHMKVLARYIRGVEHTANRAALLVSGDVQVGLQALDESEPLVPDVSHRARVRELMLFTVGPDHFELREKLGGQLEPQAEEAIRQRT